MKFESFAGDIDTTSTQITAVSLSAPRPPSTTATTLMADLSLVERFGWASTDDSAVMTQGKALSDRYLTEREHNFTAFASWTEQDQTDFVKTLIQRMCHHQHGEIDQFLKPMLQRDFIALLPSGLAEYVLSQLDAHSLCACASVSRQWRTTIAHGMLWRRLIERKVRTDSLWRGLSEKRGWRRFLFISNEQASYQIALSAANVRHQHHSHQQQLSFPPLSQNNNMLLQQDPSTHHHHHQQQQLLLLGAPSVPQQQQQQNQQSPSFQPQSIAIAAVAAIAMDGLYPQFLKQQPQQHNMPMDVEEGPVESENGTNPYVSSEFLSSAFVNGANPQIPPTQALFSVVDPMLEVQHRFYAALYPLIVQDIAALEANWRQGHHRLDRIICESEGSRGVYCLQYDDEKIVSGLRDNTIKIWGRPSLACVQTLTGHTGSVLCLQYDDQIIASGSSDSTVRIWDVLTGALLKTLVHHGEAVLHLRFQDGMLVTCSKDRSIAVWDMASPTEIDLRRVLIGHRAAVNVVDFDQRYIVSASGDRTIKVWSADTCEFVRTLNGHKRGIACLQYRDRLIVSGSSDFSIRLWDVECGNCLRELTGHEELVRCIRFDSKRIVSGAYDGKIKIWDLQAALNPLTPHNAICIQTLTEHTGRVFRLQFDDFQIVSSSHDDTILIWDFLNTAGATNAAAPSAGGQPPGVPPPNPPNNGPGGGHGAGNFPAGPPPAVLAPNNIF